MVSKRGEGGGAGRSGRQSLTPVEARQDAHDRLVGQRTLLALRIVAIITAVVFGTAGILTDPDIGGGLIESEFIRLLGVQIFTLLGIAGLAAVIVCRRPARRQVFWLTESIIAAGWLPILAGGIGLIAGFIVVPAVALISGLTTLVLLYVWRARSASG